MTEPEPTDMLRRAANAVRNLIEQVHAGAGHWADWVPDLLDRMADDQGGERP